MDGVLDRLQRQVQLVVLRHRPVWTPPTPIDGGPSRSRGCQQRLPQQVQVGELEAPRWSRRSPTGYTKVTLGTLTEPVNDNAAVFSWDYLANVTALSRSTDGLVLTGEGQPTAAIPVP